jgi:pyridoxamine 5'-phosphate oxidase-like protein
MDAIDEFIDIAHTVAWCNVATVDRRGRPRSRILHPVWERHGDALRGWVGTTATTLTVAHLAHAPYVSCSYLHPSHDTAQAECSARWVTDDERRVEAWERLRSAPPPAGYDPLPIWPDGPLGGSFAVLRLDAWRIRHRRGSAGGVPFTVWSAAA